VGLSSTQTIHHHLGKLEADGYLRRLDDRTRTRVLTEKGWEAVGNVPMLGRVAASGSARPSGRRAGPAGKLPLPDPLPNLNGEEWTVNRIQARRELSSESPGKEGGGTSGRAAAAETAGPWGSAGGTGAR